MVEFKRKEVKTYNIHAYCPECGNEMFPDHAAGVILTYPIMYPHKCCKCSYQENLTNSYPLVGYEEV